MNAQTTTETNFDLLERPDYAHSPIGMAHYTTHDGKHFVSARCYGSYSCFDNNGENNGCAAARAWIAKTLAAFIRKTDRALAKDGVR